MTQQAIGFRQPALHPESTHQPRLPAPPHTNAQSPTTPGLPPELPGPPLHRGALQGRAEHQPAACSHLLTSLFPSSSPPLSTAIGKPFHLSQTVPFSGLQTLLASLSLRQKPFHGLPRAPPPPPPFPPLTPSSHRASPTWNSKGRGQPGGWRWRGCPGQHPDSCALRVTPEVVALANFWGIRPTMASGKTALCYPSVSPGRFHNRISGAATTTHTGVLLRRDDGYTDFLYTIL